MKKHFSTFFTYLLALTVFALSANVSLASSRDGKKGNETPLAASALQKIEAGTSEAKVFRTLTGVSNLKFKNPYTGDYINTWGGTFEGEVDGQSAQFYCIDLQHGIGFYKESDRHPHMYTDEGPTSIEITYILNNYYPFNPYPYQGAASRESREAAAVQIALWHYADGVQPSTMPDSEIKSRALEIIADANANAQYHYPLETLIMIPTHQTIPSGTDASFVIKTFNNEGNPLGGVPVTLTTSSGTLSTTSFSTGTDGTFGPVTLSEGGSNNATVNAIADVVIPQGTRYLHIGAPDTYQKLVLATPAGLQRKVTAFVNWYNQGGGDCDLNGYTTFTQGGWGSPSNSTPGTIRDQYFDEIFPSGLVVGTNYTITLTSAEAVNKFLPAGGTSGALTQNYTNPTKTQLKNILAGQAVALTLNVKYDEAGKIGTNPVDIGDLVINAGPFTGTTVYDFLVIVNKALGGENTGYSFSDINDAATEINENFDNGTQDNGFLNCQAEECFSALGDFVWHDKDLDGIQDADEEGIAGVTMELIFDGNVIATDVTDTNGKYEFADLEDGYYTVRVASSNFADGGSLNNWYATKKDQGPDDTKDSDCDLDDFTASTTLGCQDDLSLDFGFFLVCLEFEKTGVDTVKPGENVYYEFTVHNCGDVTLGGGVTVYDSLINPVGNHKIWYSVVHPGETYNFTKQYTATEDDCGELVNIAKAIGHPANVDWSRAQDIIKYDDHTVFVDCTPVCLGKIGDKVWLDYKVDGEDNNCNGLQDSGEPGIANVKVILKDGLGSIIDSARTNANGYYLFEDLCDGNYIVEVDAATLPEGVTGTAVQVGSDNTIDNNGSPYSVTLSEGNRINLTIDFGYCVEEEKEADLSIRKTSSNLNPENGDQITYTITVTNNGPDATANVEVTDILPGGLLFNSATASQGSYSETTGIWSVGTLAGSSSANLDITVTIDVDTLTTSYFDLGPATGFNVFVWQDIEQPSADTEGKMAVGRNATLGNYSVGDKLTPQVPLEDVLIVGNNLTFTSGSVFNGNVVYGNSTNLTDENVAQSIIVDGTLVQGTPIDFDAAKNYFFSLSSQLAAYTANGTLEEPYSAGLILTGADPFLNVFNVDGAVLTAKSDVQIEVPNGSVVLVNISGNNISWNGGLEVRGTSISNVLYNFYEATNASISGIDIRGSILAPYATFDFSAGVQNGQMIAKSVVGSGQFNNSMFTGNIPVSEEITNCATVSSSSVTDPNENNNSDCVTITVGIDVNDGGGGTGSGDTGSTWEPVGSFGITEIVYSMANDANGNILAGTWGGNIYRSTTGEDWTKINDGMGVAFIWTLKLGTNGNIYAATEKGIYVSTNNGDSWTLMGLEDKDVRDIAFDSQGNLYAGTWGTGVFTTTNNGQTWTEISNGLVNTAINSLVITSTDELFAATFGSGVVKYNSAANSWEDLEGAYNLIWTLEVGLNDVLYAGTYGDGLYESVDGGLSWYKSSQDLPAMFVYSIVLDASNTLYVSSWAAGVFMSEDGMNFTPVGMTGAGVSSILIDMDSSTMYAGTKDGQIYMKTAEVTDVEDEGNNAVPTEYSLSQNYPNPFNPTTNIKFSVAETGNYKLIIYNILGQEITTLVNNQLNPGNYTVTFDASRLASGIYIYQFTGNNINFVKKMVMMK